MICGKTSSALGGEEVADKIFEKYSQFFSKFDENSKSTDPRSQGTSRTRNINILYIYTHIYTCIGQVA